MIDSASQLRKFEELFKKKNFKVEDICYQAWLIFKWDSIGNEQEAFNHVLKKRKPTNLQPKQKRERVAPEGSGRYHLNDARWDPIFQERMEKEAKNKKRVTNKGTSTGRRVRPVAPSTVTSGALESLTSVPSSPLTRFSDTVLANDDISNNSKPGSESAAASSTVTSVAVDSDLPDIPDLPVSDSLVRASNTTSRGKRKRGNNNNTGSKPAKRRSTEVRDTVTSTSMEFIPTAPKFPLENGLVPLIDDNEVDSSNNNNSTTQQLNTGSVVPKIKTFLDLVDQELDTDLQELEKSVATQPVPQTSKTENNNSINTTNSKTPRASGRLRSRGKTNLSSSMATSKAASTAIPLAKTSVDQTPTTNSNSTTNNNNNIVKMRSKRSSTTNSATASQSSVPITITDDGDKIIDQNAIPTMKLKSAKFAKFTIKKEKNNVKRKK